MKKLLTLSLMLLSFGLIFVACSSDDEDEEPSYAGQNYFLFRLPFGAFNKCKNFNILSLIFLPN